jgi:hypothetical protein
LTPIALNVGGFDDGAMETNNLMRRLAAGQGDDGIRGIDGGASGSSGHRWGGQDESFFAFAGSNFNRALDHLEDSLADQDFQFRVVVGAMTGVTTVFSVGYVFWALKGGYLLASVLSSLPAWATFDPLPVLDEYNAPLGGGRRREDHETLESILAQGAPAANISGKGA